MTEKKYEDEILAALTPQLYRDNSKDAKEYHEAVKGFRTGTVTEMIADYTDRFIKELSDRGFIEETSDRDFTGEIDPLSFEKNSDEYLMAGLVYFGQCILNEVAYFEDGGRDVDELIYHSMFFGVMRHSLTSRMFPLSNEQTIADLAIHGASFSKHKPAKANRARRQKMIDRKNWIIDVSQKALDLGFGRFKSGKINQRDLARRCLKLNTPLKETRVRQVIRDAVRNGKLA